MAPSAAPPIEAQPPSLTMDSVKAALLGVPGSGTPPSRSLTPLDHKVANTSGYTDTVFEGKAEQAAQVQRLLKEKGFMPASLVDTEVNWFYGNLGISDTYFALETVETIADHIMALFGAKILAYTKHSNSLEIDLEHASDEGAVFIHSSQAGHSQQGGPQWERRIDTRYLNKSSVSTAYRLETYRSAGSVSAQSKQQLRCYFLNKCVFPDLPPPSSPGFSDIRLVSDKTFLSKASENTLAIYQAVMEAALARAGPVIELFEVEGSRERRVVIGYKMGTTTNFFSALSDLYHFYGLFSSRKYVEHFSNGVTIISIYLNPLPASNSPPIEHSIHQVIKEASLIYVLPDNPFFGSAGGGDHAVQEAAYAYCGWLFAQHFCNRLGQAYQALRKVLDETDAAQASILNDIKLRFREETFTRQSIMEVITSHPDLIRLLYVHFAHVHYPGGAEHDELVPTLSYQRLVKEEVLSDEQMYDRIRKAAANSHEAQVLEAFLVFNKAVLKTNFYIPTKVALSFSMDPSFLPEAEYPVKPYSILFVMGSDFRGFHVRFKDVARGGIRIVRSRNRENYSINQRMIFDEVYNLASTQHLKNTTIVEGGSKGAILPSLDDQGQLANEELCFHKYVDAVIDILLPNEETPIVDLLGKQEVLFFGPDEGTAGMMDWAALHARSRGAPWWKSFTTGKTAATLGGVPHDTWGMTSLSVRQFEVGIYRKMGWKESEVTKVQTGGPDGDLGSNEILLSTDKTVAIIDGSGVIHDPRGLDRAELVRLAKARKMVSHFDVSKLSPAGYRVLVEDRDVKLPSGEVVPDGIAFRNTAHLIFKADVFVPCGGRPESVNISNVGRLFDRDGKCHFKAVVEGANLFVTKQARIELEKRGVIVIPDASANKGGVTSSSLEVLCGLSLTDDEYTQSMTFKDGRPPKFYLSYVADIQNTIVTNAEREFEAIWAEHTKTGKPRPVLSAELAIALNKLTEELEATDLFDDVRIRSAVMAKVFPRTLVAKVGLEELCKRVPESYARSAFAALLAVDFVYKHGPGASIAKFYQHIKSLTAA